MFQSFSLTVITQCLYVVTSVRVLEVCVPCCIGLGGGSVDPLARAATYAHDAVVAFILLKLVMFSGVVLNPIESLTTVMSFWMI